MVRISPEARELFTAGNAVCTLGAWNMFRVSLTTSQTLVGIMQVYVRIVWTECECLTQVTLPLLNLRVMVEFHEISDIRIPVFCVWSGRRVQTFRSNILVIKPTSCTDSQIYFYSKNKFEN